MNPEASHAVRYLELAEEALEVSDADMIGVSAGFDNHLKDWGGLLSTRDYQILGRLVRQTADRNQGGCFGILEGGYNHDVLGRNVWAFLRGMGGEVD